MKTVIIVAGGRGRRMNGDIPKQFLPVNGIPVLMKTISCFYRYSKKINIILVLPKDEAETWKNLCISYKFDIPHKIAEGGAERFFSVKNALALVGDNEIVAIHDGVRPFVSNETIERCFNEAENSGAAIPVMPLTESIRYFSDNESKAVPRDEYKIVQTPQVFKSKILLAAYAQEYSPHFTDDASVVEKWGHKIIAVEGNRENIKITTPFDMLIAEVLSK